MTLTDALSGPSTTIESVGAYLDGLDGGRRVAELRGLDRDRQRTLYRLAADSPPLTLADLAPDGAPLAEVVHDGVNTLPVPGALRRFQKRLCRPGGGGDELFGYNEGPLRRLIGPGYFVA